MTYDEECDISEAAFAVAAAQIENMWSEDISSLAVLCQDELEKRELEAIKRSVVKGLKDLSDTLTDIRGRINSNTERNVEAKEKIAQAHDLLMSALEDCHD